MFSYNVKFLTSDESFPLKNGDFKSYKYETKKKSEESVYDCGKRSYCERRGGHWMAVKPRQIRQLESIFKERTAVYCDWLNDNLIVIVFSSGAIAYLTVKPNTLDVTQILFDRYVVGKISGQSVTGVAFCKSHLLFTHTDRTATLITFGKSISSAQPCRIRDRDPHIQTVELGGSRRTERKISWCETNSGVKVLVWGSTAVEPAPWSPVLEDHANMHLYQIKGQQMSLIAYHQLENETLCAEISSANDNVIHIVEQTTCHKSGVTVEWSRYTAPTSELRATSLRSTAVERTSCTLSAPARVARRAACGRRVLAACIDGSLHVIHTHAGLTHSTRLGSVATDIRWAGALVLAASDGGRLQCMDGALAPLPHPPHLSTILREPRRMHMLATRSGCGGPLVLASFSGGPLALLHISHPDLMTAWNRSGRPANAISLLRSLDWDLDGPACLRATSALVSGALRGALGPDGEARAQAALGAYLAPRAPHAPNAQKYAPAVHDLARKFFHHLLRRGRVEKALSLCVDLAAWDLCMDARWAAARCGHTALAAEAASLAATVASTSLGWYCMLLRRGRVEKALSLCVDLAAWDLCMDARWAAARCGHTALAAEAASLAATVASTSLGWYCMLLRRGRVEKALSLCVDLAAWDLCMDARWAAARCGHTALAAEAASLAATVASTSLGWYCMLLRRGRVEKALSLCVDLAAWDLCMDARWAAARCGHTALAAEAASLAATVASTSLGWYCMLLRRGRVEKALSLCVDLAAWDLCMDARWAAARCGHTALAAEAASLAATVASTSLGWYCMLLRRGRVEKALSLCVDLAAWDLCMDARWAAARCGHTALAAEAASLAATVASTSLGWYCMLLRRGRVEKALSLCVDLAAWDLCMDARWAAARCGHTALAAEAASLAATVASTSLGWYCMLLRRGRVEKALSLCVDLAAWDLCMDARWAAARCGHTALAAEAASLAATVASTSLGWYCMLLRRGRVEKALSLCVDLAAWDLCMDARWAAARCGHTALAAEAASLAATVASTSLGWYCMLLRRGRVEKALSLCVDLAAWDLCMDARWAAARCGHTALAAEAASLAATVASTSLESVCSDSCSQCSDTNSESSASSSRPPPLPRLPLPLLPVPVPTTPPYTTTTSIRPNLHQYLEKNNTIWNIEVKDDWSREPSIEVIPRPETVHFRHLFQTELREEAPNTMYRYNGYRPGSTERAIKLDGYGIKPEKNKVKFSDTVTIAVVASEGNACGSVARELADSLPLCAPHNYLAAFAPHPAPAPAPAAAPPPPPGTNDYVEV